MRILLDECVHARVREAFPGYAVKTVKEAGWGGASDASVLGFAEKHFDVFVTIDRKLEHQQQLHQFKLGFVIARVGNNTLASYQPLFEELRLAAERLRGGQVIHVGGRQP